MNKNEIYNLLIKYADGEASSEEIIFIEKLISKDKYWKSELEILQKINVDLLSSDIYKVNPATELNWEFLNKSIALEQNKKFNFSYFNLLKYAAASVLLIVTAWFLFYKGNSIKDFNKFNIGKIYSTSNNEIIDIALSDGSVITLNQNSKLTVDKDFNIKNRIVEINGEAYFEIAKEKSKPFIAKSNNTFIKVLGTIFKSKNDKNKVEICLYEGKVNFISNKNSNELTPGEKLVFTTNSDKIKISKIQSNDVKFWENKLIFKDVKLQIIAEKLQIRYNITLIIPDNKKDEKYTVSFEGMNLENSLKLLESVTESNISKNKSKYFLNH